MSEDGEDENHKLNPECLENLVFPKSKIVTVVSKSTAKQSNGKFMISTEDSSQQSSKVQK
jgi:hypothetical protein